MTNTNSFTWDDPYMLNGQFAKDDWMIRFDRVQASAAGGAQ